MRVTCRASPVFMLTSRFPDSSSHLFPTNITGMPVRSPLTCVMGYWQRAYTFLQAFLTSPTISSMFLSSSRLCRDVTEKTRMKAWPLEMLRRCMAGNWCDPVVSVICIVQMVLFEDIT